MELAEAYDLAVTAEGVETEAQMRALADTGCRHMQGYLFCRPQPIEDWAMVAGRAASVGTHTRERRTVVPALVLAS